MVGRMITFWIDADDEIWRENAIRKGSNNMYSRYTKD